MTTVTLPSWKEKAHKIKEKLAKVSKQITMEPAMFLDGVSYSVMIVATENLQMNTICRVNLNYTEQVCSNISAYTEESKHYQEKFGYFQQKNGVLMSILPLFFILFVGAWSDKYGRKLPIMAATFGHVLWATCYLVKSIMSDWPVETLYVAAILDTIGGGAVSFLTTANAYITDVTNERQRTARVGTANSIWFLGGPLGTFIGTYIYMYGGFLAVFTTSAIGYSWSFLYLMALPETRGPFAKSKKHSIPELSASVNSDSVTEKSRSQAAEVIKSDVETADEKSINSETGSSEGLFTEKGYGKLNISLYHQINKQKVNEDGSLSLNESEEDTESEAEEKVTVLKMLKDLVDYHRIVDSFRSTLRSREGHGRTFVILLIICNMLRRLGRGAFMNIFTRTVLQWGPTSYGIWVSYKNLLSAVGSLVAVPLLSTRAGLSDSVLALIGAVASIADYVFYGLVTSSLEVLIWLGPVVGVLCNSLVIAIRSMLSKFVPADEIGKVFAVMGALDGVLPMVSVSLYNMVFQASIGTFPGAQFFFGAGANVLCTLIFMVIISWTKSKSYDISDLETVKVGDPITLQGFRDLTRPVNPGLSSHDQRQLDKNSRMVVGVLQDQNFIVASTHQRRKCLPKSRRTSKSNQTHLCYSITNENKLVCQAAKKNTSLKLFKSEGKVTDANLVTDERRVHAQLVLSLSAPPISTISAPYLSAPPLSTTGRMKDLELPSTSESPHSVIDSTTISNEKSSMKKYHEAGTLQTLNKEGRTNLAYES